MKVIFNNNTVNISEKTTIIKLLEDNNIKNFKGIAIAVNNKVVPNEEWNNYFLNEGDKVILIQATCGG